MLTLKVRKVKILKAYLVSCFSAQAHTHTHTHRARDKLLAVVFSSTANNQILVLIYSVSMYANVIACLTGDGR